MSASKRSLLERYFERIGIERPPVPSIDGLRWIVAAHIAAIPFENLDQLAGEVTSVVPEEIARKLVDRERGGYCYEHNILLEHVLNEIGYRVVPAAARVLWRKAETDPVGGRHHVSLMVDCADSERPVLADAGFAGFRIDGSVPIAKDFAPSSGGGFRLVPIGELQLRLETTYGGGWVPLYSFEPIRSYPDDHEASNWFLCTHPESFFRTTLLAARGTDDRRITLDSHHLTIRHLRGDVERRQMTTVDQFVDALRRELRIDTDDVPALHDSLGRILATRDREGTERLTCGHASVTRGGRYFGASPFPASIASASALPSLASASWSLHFFVAVSILASSIFWSSMVSAMEVRSASSA